MPRQGQRSWDQFSDATLFFFLVFAVLYFVRDILLLPSKMTRYIKIIKKLTELYWGTPFQGHIVYGVLL